MIRDFLGWLRGLPRDWLLYREMQKEMRAMEQYIDTHGICEAILRDVDTICEQHVPYALTQYLHQMEHDGVLERAMEEDAWADFLAYCKKYEVKV